MGRISYSVVMYEWDRKVGIASELEKRMIVPSFQAL
jgi:hypothetical protein